RFSLDRVNAAPAVWDYAKLNHLNGQYIRQLSVEDLADRIAPHLTAAGFEPSREKVLAVTPLIQERITTLTDAAAAADFFFQDQLADYDAGELIPKKGDDAVALLVLEAARAALEAADFSREALEAVLRGEAETLGVKAGQMFAPIRVAVTGRKVSPPLFETLEVLGRETCLKRVDVAVAKLAPAA
ncbi:MAG: glutamate--tRNA ligase, partial [bacterium]|nr:glutamate--tRNA ligase [bacterium]